MRIASTVTGGMVTATGVQGSFWGPLKLQQLKISLAAADIEIDDAELDADFTQLARRRLDVARLSAARVTIALKPGTPHESPPSDEGAITRWPLTLAIRGERLGALGQEEVRGGSEGGDKG